MWRWQRWALGLALGMTASAIGPAEIAAQEPEWRRPPWRADLPSREEYHGKWRGVDRSPWSGRDPYGAYPAPRRDYGGWDRAGGRARGRGRDWPLDQSRTYRAPRDAYGGRWIYVRPSPRYSRYGSRYPRQADASAYGGYDRYPSRWRELPGQDHGARLPELLPEPLPEPRIASEPPRSGEALDVDRFPYSIGRRRDF